MIELVIEPYCHTCKDFQPDVKRPSTLYSGSDEYEVGNTTVHCIYRKRCANIKRFLERQTESDVASE